MKAFTFLVGGLFLFQTTLAPLAQAREASLASAVDDAVLFLDNHDAELIAEDGSALTSATFQSLIPERFSIVASGIRFEVKLGSLKHGVSYTVKAVEVASAKVLSRRQFSLSGKDPEAVKLSLEQTAESMNSEIEKKLPQKSASLLEKVRFALSSLFGVPVAHAGGHGPFKGLLRFVVAVLIIYVVVKAMNGASGATKAFIGLGGLILLLSILGCDSAPSGYKRNPGYDYAPEHARQFIPKYVPESEGEHVFEGKTIKPYRSSDDDDNGSGFRSNPGYERAPAHARQFIPRTIPD